MSTSDEKELAFNHWLYIQDVLTVHGEDEETIRKVGFHYRTAFIHGWKHAMEHLAEGGPKWESKP